MFRPPRPGSLADVKSTGVELLLHLAGQLPDELLELARDRLTVGDLAEVGRLVRFGHAAYGCTVPPDCLDAARELFAAADAPEDVTARLVFPRTLTPPYEFGPVAPENPYRPVSRPLDLASGLDSPELFGDEGDQAVVSRCRDTPGLNGVWRTWRHPVGQASWPAPLRVVIAEISADADPLTVRALLRPVAGPDAVVEVLRAGARVPVYHERARAESALLWAAKARRPQVVAPDVDALDQLVWGCANHLRAKFRRFLESGVDLPGLSDWRTDGEWIWPASYVGHLDRHGIVSHGPLLEHARERDFGAGEVDSVTAHQALAALHRSR